MKKEKQLSRKTKLTFDNKKPFLYCFSSKKKKMLFILGDS